MSRLSAYVGIIWWMIAFSAELSAADEAKATVSMTEKPATVTSSGDALFRFSATGGAQTECSFDGSDWIACETEQEFSYLTDGEHRFGVRVLTTDGSEAMVEHAWTIDTQFPQTTITAYPATMTMAREAEFTFSADEEKVSFFCTLDDGGASSCKAPQRYANLSEGRHVFLVKARDEAGNAGEEVRFSWTVDLTAPKSLLGSTPALINKNETVFEFSANEENTTFQCRIDSGAWEDCRPGKKYGRLVDGAHVFAVRARDAVGNAEQKPVEASWTVDTTPPSTVLTATPKKLMNTRDAEFVFSVSETGARAECALDTGSWEPCVSPKKLSGLAEGSRLFKLRAVDKAGNVEREEKKFSWDIDGTPPTTTVKERPAELTNKTGAKISFALSEKGATAECRLDGGSGASCLSSVQFDGLKDGEHSVTIQSVDAAGNKGEPATVRWVVDTIPPDTTIETKVPALSSSTEAVFKFAATEAKGRFECNLNSGGWTVCEGSKKIDALKEGRSELKVRAIDAAGNSDASPATFSWEIDATDPVTKLTQKPLELQNTSIAEFVFSTVEQGTRFLCRLDTAPFSDCGATVKYPKLEDGKHTFAVKAIDRAGNSEKEPVSYSWTVDTRPPSAKITVQPAAAVNKVEARFEFTSDESGSLFECRLDNAAWGRCENGMTYKKLAEGAHIFSVRAIDWAKNVQPGTADYLWNIDLTPPDTIIDLVPDALTGETTARFKFSAKESVTGFDCRLDTADWVPCGTEKSYEKLIEGAHAFAVRAKDRAGNSDATPALFKWNIDLTPPVTTLNAVPPKASNSASALFSFTAGEKLHRFDCRLDDDDWEKCASEKKYETLAEGKHSFSVRAVDVARNLELRPPKHEWVIDLTAPDTEIKATPKTLMNVDVAVFEFSSNQTGSRFECRLDGKEWAPCETKKQLQKVSEGQRTFEVRSIDAAGNIDVSPASYQWTIDLTPPKTVIGKTSAVYNIETIAFVEFSSDPDVAGYSCRLDKQPWQSCVSPIRYQDLREGDHQIEVKAIDKAGNAEATPARFEWLIPLQFVHVSAGYQHSCAVGNSKALYCWGNNGASQLGTDDQQDSFVPIEASQAASFKWERVSAGRFHGCGIAEKNGERRLYCWGSNGSGQLGTGDDRSGPKPIEIKGQHTDWIQVTSGISHSCAIRSEGGRNGLYCWGENKAGQAGDPSFNIVQTPRPLTGKQYGWVYVTGGFSHTCAIRNEEGKKKLYCWGADSDGQLGIGTTERAHPEPTEVSGGFDDWTEVSGGYYHTCGIRDEGGARKLYCWGNGATGQRGDGAAGKKPTPVPIAGENSSWRALSAGSNHTCAIRDEGTDRTLYCWGDNRYGQLGGAGDDRSNKPLKIKSTYSDWFQMSAGETHTCAVREKSGRYQMFCWGRNQYGQLGDGTEENRFMPVEVTGKQPKKYNVPNSK